MLLKAARAIVIIDLLLATWWLLALATAKDGGEMADSIGTLIGVTIFLYNVPLLIAAFMVKRAWPIRIVFSLVLLPWVLLLLMWLGALSI